MKPGPLHWLKMTFLRNSQRFWRWVHPIGMPFQGMEMLPFLRFDGP
jgi:hypothetical protein